MKTRTARAVVMFLASSVAVGALTWVMSASLLAATSAQFVYERPETRTMPSPLPRVPQAPPGVLPEVVVERGTAPPPAPSPPEEQPPPMGEVKPPPGQDEVPIVGDRLPVTGLDALLILVAAGMAGGVGYALRRAASVVPVMSRSRLQEITFAVPELAVADDGLTGAAADDHAAEDGVGGRGQGGAGALLVLGAVALAGGLGLARRRGGSSGRRRSASKTGARAPSRRVEPTGSLLVSLAVPALARRLALRTSTRARAAAAGAAPRRAPVRPADEGATLRMARPGR